MTKDLGRFALLCGAALVFAGCQTGEAAEDEGPAATSTPGGHGAGDADGDQGTIPGAAAGGAAPGDDETGPEASMRRQDERGGD